jgi:hypothetical protein
LLITNELVEAAGVEPDISVENTQLTDSENASIAENATISKSAVRSLYKDCPEFPELQPSDFPASCKNTLKRSCSISDIGRCKPQGNPRQFLNAFSFEFFQCDEQEDRRAFRSSLLRWHLALGPLPFGLPALCDVDH